MPDLTLERGHGGSQGSRPLNLFLRTGLGGTALISPSEETQPMGEFFLDLNASLIDNPTRFLQVHSYGSLLWEPRADDLMERDPMSIRGIHHLRGMVRFAEQADSGVDVVVEGEAGHSAQRPIALQDLRIGNAPFLDLSAGAALVMWRNVEVFDEDIQLVIPITYDYGMLDYDDDFFAPVGGVERHEIGSGFGLRSTNPMRATSYFELIGVSYGTQSHAAGQAGDACDAIVAATGLPCTDPEALEAYEATQPTNIDPRSRLDGVESLDLRVLHADHLTVVEFGSMALSVNFMVGAEWLWNREQARDAAFVTVETGVVARSTQHGGSAGFNVDVGPTVSPDGRRFLSDVRLELVGEWSDANETIGASMRAAFNWASDLEQEVDYEAGESGQVAGRFGLRAGWFSRVGPVRLDFFHHATNTPLHDGTEWDYMSTQSLDGGDRQQWVHEVGATVSWAGDLLRVGGSRFDSSGSLTCAGRSCYTGSGLGHNLNNSVQWDPCGGDAFEVTAQVDFENGFDYVSIDGIRYDGRDRTFTATVAGATTVMVHTDGSVRSGGIRNMQARCLPPTTPGQLITGGQIMVCDGPSCTGTTQPLPHGYSGTFNWSPCFGEPFSWNAHVDLEPNYDTLTIDSVPYSGYNSYHQGYSNGNSTVSLRTDSSVVSQGVYYLTATCGEPVTQILQPTPTPTNQSTILYCDGLSCTTPISPLPHSRAASVLWNPCNNGGFTYSGSADLEQGFDYLSIAGTSFNGREVTLSGHAYGQVEVALSTDGSVDSAGIYALNAMCDVVPQPIHEEPTYGFHDGMPTDVSTDVILDDDVPADQDPLEWREEEIRTLQDIDGAPVEETVEDIVDEAVEDTTEVLSHDEMINEVEDDIINEIEID